MNEPAIVGQGPVSELQTAVLLMTALSASTAPTAVMNIELQKEEPMPLKFEPYYNHAEPPPPGPPVDFLRLPPTPSDETAAARFRAERAERKAKAYAKRNP